MQIGSQPTQSPSSCFHMKVLMCVGNYGRVLASRTTRINFSGVPSGAILQHSARHSLDNNVERGVVFGRGADFSATPRSVHAARYVGP